MDKSAVATRKDIDDVLDVVKDLVARFDERFEEVDARFDKMDARFDAMEIRFDKRFNRLDKKVDSQKTLLESRIEKIETDNTLIKKVLAL